MAKAEKRRDDACALLKLRENENTLLQFPHEVFWSAMRLRIAFRGHIVAELRRARMKYGLTSPSLNRAAWPARQVVLPLPPQLLPLLR
jgi:hypothetical protein